MKQYILHFFALIVALSFVNDVWGQTARGTLPDPKDTDTSDRTILKNGIYTLTKDYTPGNNRRWNINFSTNTDSVIVDLNGFTINGTNINRTIFNVARGKLIIRDSSVEKDGKIINSKMSCFFVSPSASYTSRTATLIIESGTIDSCRPSDGNGGAMEITARGTVTMKGGTIINCRGAQGAAVYCNGGTFNMTGGVIKNNKVNSIVNNGNWQLPEIDELPIGITTSYDKGGAVYVDKGNFSMSGGTITGNVSNLGGAVYVTNGANFSLTGGKIEGNYATSSQFRYGNGGAIYINAGSTCTIEGNATSPIIISGNKSTRYGGGIYADGATVTIKNCNITGNYANCGGGLVLEKTNTTACVMNLYNCNLEDNVSKVTTLNSTVGGGAVFMTDGTLNVKSSSNIIDNNSNSGLGGGIYIVKGNLNIDAGAILNAKGNDAKNGGAIYLATGNISVNGTINAGGDGSSTDSNTAQENGGAIYLNNGNLTLNNGSFFNNTAKTGGGIFMGSGTFTLKGTATLNSNKATSGDGGGIYLNSGTFTVSSTGTINVGSENMPNTASGNGGGIYCAGTFKVDGTALIAYNQAMNGGGVCVQNGSVTLPVGESSRIINNEATELGGGLYVVNTNSTTNPTVSFNGGIFTGNSAKSGGAVCASGKMTLTLGASMENNTATDGVGGGIYMVDGVTMTFKDGLIRANSALQSSYNTNEYETAQEKIASAVSGVGGGIFMANSAKLTFDSKEMGIYNNSATNAGADICANGKNTTITLPQIGGENGMNLRGFDVPGNDLYWIEDYFNGETNTYSGKVGIRYEKALESKDIVNILDYKVEAATYSSKYLCVDLGYDLVFVDLKTEGLNLGDDAAIEMLYPSLDEITNTYTNKMYRKVLFNGEQTKTVALPSGDWKFNVTAWSYKYVVSNYAPDHITQSVDNNKPAYTDKYINVKSDGLNGKGDYEKTITIKFEENSAVHSNVKEYQHRKVNRMRVQ